MLDPETWSNRLPLGEVGSNADVRQHWQRLEDCDITATKVAKNFRWVVGLLIRPGDNCIGACAIS